MDVNLEYYRIFCCVAKYGSITQAAAELHTGQPNVTRAIKNLEAGLGCSLFVRNNRGVTMTAEGSKLYAHISTALRHIELGEQGIAMDRSLERGLVQIASSEVALRCCLLPVLARFRREHPGVRIKLTNHSTPQAIDTLRNGFSDFAVVSSPRWLPEHLTSQELLRVRMVPVCGPAFANLQGSTVTLSELASLPMVCMNPKTTTFSLLQGYFNGHQVPLSPDIEVDTADQLLPLIQSGLGVGFVPEGFITQHDLDMGISVLTLDTPLPELPLCIIKRTSAPLSLAARELERMLWDACL